MTNKIVRHTSQIPFCHGIHPLSGGKENVMQLTPKGEMQLKVRDFSSNILVKSELSILT
ncbi:hypothetical protein J4G71_08685 [Vibrio fluvialis]|uniref:Uncharacterized protein n=1 Tax=Vibrio fluvialis PG41 TaxID=1336752 RepID=S7HXG4_VIBFL|nr:hypothetical protein L910_2283 [Vibrio fluvialis PG41]MBO1533847.1 hypothetical protein [Vibrio fluvialis]